MRSSTKPLYKVLHILLGDNSIPRHIITVLRIRAHCWQYFKLKRTTLPSFTHEIFCHLALTFLHGYSQTTIYFSSVTYLKVVNMGELLAFKLVTKKCLLIAPILILWLNSFLTFWELIFGCLLTDSTLFQSVHLPFYLFRPHVFSLFRYFRQVDTVFVGYQLFFVYPCMLCFP